MKRRKDNRWDYIKYTWQHKLAFIAVEYLLFNRVTLRGLMHDMDKLIMYCLGVNIKKAHAIHRLKARHHIHKYRSNNDFESAIIDWECCRFTKEDKPLNAYDTLYTHYPEFEKEILPILKRLKINHKTTYKM